MSVLTLDSHETLDGGRELDELEPVPLKVLIADDHPLILVGLRRALDREDDIEVIGEARTGTELLGMIERRQPDVVVLDLNMPGLDGRSCVERISAAWPDVKTIVLSACEERASIEAALRGGACAYIVKSVSSLDIAAVVRQARGGAVFHAPPVAPGYGRPAESGPGLTERECTILAAIADGLTTRAISQQLWVSEHTVKFHLTNIYRKLGVSNRSAAVRYAFERQLTSAP